MELKALLRLGWEYGSMGDNLDTATQEMLRALSRGAMYLFKAGKIVTLPYN